MPRLDPAYPPLWRSLSTLQFGPDAAVVLSPVAPWQEHLLALLREGFTSTALDSIAALVQAEPGAIDAFLERLAPVLSPMTAPEPVRLECSSDLPAATVEAIGDGLSDGGFTVARSPDAAGAGTIVVTEHVLDPRETAALMSQDRPHLPITITCGGVQVGPVIIPGHSACATCLALSHRDHEPWWPVVTAQLVGTRAPRVSPTLAGRAGMHAAELLRTSGASELTRSLILRAGEATAAVREHRPHPECCCRSLQGIGTVIAFEPPPPSSATGSRRRA